MAERHWSIVSVNLCGPKAYPAPVPNGQSVLPGTSHSYMLDMIGSQKRVLEFGCATGYMSEHLKRAGCRVTGVEIDALAAEDAKAFCDDVIVADLDFRPLTEVLPAGSLFDVVVFGDVLEHLRDPWQVLDESRRFLAPGGYTVMSIPNVAHGSVRLNLLHGAFDYSELGVLDDTHLRFFTLKTVQDLCLRAGYRITAMERTKVGLFEETDLTPHMQEMHFDPELVEQIRQDPEHDTLQFVVRAEPLNDREKFEIVSKQLIVVRERLRSAELSIRVSQEAYDEVEAELRERVGEPYLTVLDNATLANARTRPTSMSARAIKRAETLSIENESLRGELSRAAERFAELETSLARSQELVSEADGRAAQESARLADARRKIDEAERALASARERYERMHDTMSAAIARFLSHAETELASARARITDVDSAIAEITRSRFWALKKIVRKFLR